MQKTPALLRALLTAIMTIASADSHLVADDSRCCCCLARNDALANSLGGRSRLDASGINLKAQYALEMFSNVSGGVSTNDASKVMSYFDLDLGMDVERIASLSGGSVNFSFEVVSGETNGINPQVSGLAACSALNSISGLNTDAPITQLSYYYYEQVSNDKRLKVKLGKYDPSNDFLSSDIENQFISGGIEPPVNVAMPTYPNPSLGVSVLFDPNDDYSLKGGVYGGRPAGNVLGDDGIIAGEIYVHAQIDRNVDVDGLAGRYGFGAWIVSIDTPQITTLSTPSVFDVNYGFWLLFDQALWHEPCNSSQGVEVYFQVTWAPPDRNQVQWWAAVGAVYTGLLPCRDADKTGFTIIDTETTPRLRAAGQTRELVLEWFYQFNPRPWFTLQPDMQYIINPAANGRNALAVGLRSSFSY